MPLLALVVGLIAAAQAGVVLQALPVLPALLFPFVAYLLGAGVIALGLAAAFRLSTPVARTLAFSLGMRNSFVVLPVALALPAGWETTVVVIVFQSLVELFGMAFYLWWVPQRLFAR